MSVWLLLLLAPFALLVLIAIWFWALYNSLVALRNRIDNAWAQVEVQLQRRLDLIPNLVNTVKGYADHEKETLERVISARTRAVGASTPEQHIDANTMLTGALKSLFALSESYPDLKANQSFLKLQAELAETEDKISYMRQSYNDTVMKYNTRIQQFPAVMVAKALGFSEQRLYKADEAAASAAQVEF